MLKTLLAQMEQAAEAGDSKQVGECDIRFHEVLVARSGSERLVRLHATEVVEARLCIQAMGSAQDDDHDRVAEHRAITNAIRSGDAAEADRLLHLHMTDAVRDLLQLADTPAAQDTG